MRPRSSSAIIGVLVALCSWQQAYAAVTHDIPRLTGIAVDGDGSDWIDDGFRLDLMVDDIGLFKDESDFDPRMRLAWNDEGLLVLATVKDGQFVEHDYLRHLFKGDSIEFFVASAVGANDFYMLVIAPGLDPQYPEPRSIFFDQRDDVPTIAFRPKELHAKIARKAIPGGYCLEVMLPWDNLGIQPTDGLEFGFQIYAMDRDKLDGEAHRAIWFPAADTHTNRTSSMYGLRLAQKPGAPIRAAARMGNRRVEVVGTQELGGKTAVVAMGGRVLAQNVLEKRSRYATASIEVPGPHEMPFGATLAIQVDGQIAAELTRPLFGETLQQALALGELGFSRYVFVGPQFPEIGFRKREQAEQLVGRVDLHARFFDGDGREVKNADKAGRYGAVVEIVPEFGRSTRRFFTLCRAADTAATQPSPAPSPLPATRQPSMGGLTVGGVPITLKSAEQHTPVRDPKDAKDPGQPAAAVILAGEMDCQNRNEVRPAPQECDLLDQAWWVHFKRQHYGVADKYRNVFTGPDLTSGAPAPELREGTPEEAGMKPEVVAALDQLFSSGDGGVGNDAAAVCIARKRCDFSFIGPTGKLMASR